MKYKITQQVTLKCSSPTSERTGVIVGIVIQYKVKFDSGFVFLIDEDNIEEEKHE